MKTFRSLLFVPGIRPERFAKAIAAGADAVCIDLEDAVPPHEKAEARAAVMAYLGERGDDLPCKIGVRVNPLDTSDGLKDLLAFQERDVAADFLMLPKAQETRDFQIIDSVLGNGFLQHRRMAFWAVVETIAGLKAAGSLAGWCSARGGILFGGADYSTAIGTSMDWEPLFYARSKLVSEAKIVMGGLLDVPFLDVKDEAGLRAECERVKALGFLGKACIHPSQVATVNAVFSPTEAEITWAKRVMQANMDHKGSALLLDGKLLDAPVFLRAERILSQAGIEI